MSQIQFFVITNEDGVPFVADKDFLKEKGLTLEDAQDKFPQGQVHTINLKAPFTAKDDQKITAKTGGNQSRWADCACEVGIVEWTLKEYSPNEAGLLSMPLTLANAIRAMVTNELYAPIKNPFLTAL